MDELPRARKDRTPDDPRAVAWVEAKNMFGGQYIASAAKMTPQAIYAWDIVPAEWCVLVERCTGISRHRLRPDIYGPVRSAVSLADIAANASIAIFMQRLSKHLDVPLRQLVYWDRVPPEYVLRVEKLTGVSRYVLRPDVFGIEPFDTKSTAEPDAQAALLAKADEGGDGSSVAA